MKQQGEGQRPVEAGRRIAVDVSKLFGVAGNRQAVDASKVGAVKTGTAVGAVKIEK